MATIGFHVMRGEIAHYGPETKDHTRIGLDGHLFQHIGQRGRPSSIQIQVRVADDTAWTTFDTNIKTYEGSINELSHLVDGWTQNVYLHKVIPRTRVAKPILAASDGSTRLWIGSLEIQPTD